MADDDGKGLRALFYGLCSLWDIDVWDGEQAGPMPADFYLLSGMGAYVVIVPEPADRQAEIANLRSSQERFIVLDDWDLDEFRSCRHKVAAAQWLHLRVRTGDTHAARERRHLGLST